ncbi:MAG: hypothetical protein KF712_20835 [Akkermansiaceae bacterium]|nr:hypothetical protein [Akkermansiaceae bacterium]
MKVRCRFNQIGDIPEIDVKNRLAESIHRNGSDDDLVEGTTYAVFALARWNDGGLRVYLHTIKESEHPYPYPLEMFEVVDPNIPENWKFVFEQRPTGLEIKLMSFPEWIEDIRFYEKLVEGDECAIASYNLQRFSVKPRPTAGA